LLLLLIASKKVVLGLLRVVAEYVVTFGNIEDVTCAVVIVEHDGLKLKGSVP
jgi:hypothetical protein